MKEKYKELMSKAQEIQVIEEISSLMGWDTLVMLPEGSVEQRGNQMAYISKLAHLKSIDPLIGIIIKEILEHPEYEKISETEKRNIYLVKREYDKKTKLPTDFVAEFTKQSVITHEIWKNARKNNDFATYLPFLEKMIEFGKKYAHYLNPDLSPYDVMLDFFEPGMSVESYTRIFTPLKVATVELIKKCQNASNKPDETIIHRHCPTEIQKKISDDIIPLIGYDLKRGRLDIAAHPFTTGSYDDVRITTRYLENHFTSSLFATMHEAGHGCYDQNQKKEWRYQPIGNYCSMGIHESSSRFYENIIGRSESFWKFYFSRFKEITGTIFEDVTYEQFIFAINSVKSSAIRVEADEVTYNLHIILRFEIEKDLIEGNIEVADLPKVWNEKMREMLGYDVQDDAEGVMQDVHWSGGMVGYFPTYSMGNIFGAQFFAKLKKDIPNWKEELENGNIEIVTNWFKENIHEKGNMYDPSELLKGVTGEEPTPKYLIDYLNEKYSKLYNF